MCEVYKYDDRYKYAVDKDLLCISHIYGNFTQGKVYPIHWQIRGHKKDNKFYCDPYIKDDEGDDMPVKYLINKSNNFTLINTK